MITRIIKLNSLTGVYCEQCSERILHRRASYQLTYHDGKSVVLCEEDTKSALQETTTTPQATYTANYWDLLDE